MCLLDEIGGQIPRGAQKGFDDRGVFGLADEVESAERFPCGLGVGREDAKRLAGLDCGAGGLEPVGKDTGDGAADFDDSLLRGNARDHCAGANCVPHFETLAERASGVLGNQDGIRLEHGEELRAARGIGETDEGERGVGTDHGVGVGEHGEQGLMECGDGIIAAHDPGGGQADLRIGVA